MKTLFGTDGIRSQVNKDLLKQDSLHKLGAAIGKWIHNQQQSKPSLIIAHDTRSSSNFISSALKFGLLPYNISIYNAGVMPTPFLFHELKHKNYTAGIMITASHNPYTYNGIKIINRNNGKLSKEDEELITKYYYENTTQDLEKIKFSYLESENTIKNTNLRYLHYIKSYFPENFLKNITVVLDTAHGATYKLAPYIFQYFGASVITINNSPNGANINDNSGTTNPKSLQEAVLKYKANIGIAFDGDGDRIIVVSKNGHIKNGDDILALLSNYKDYKSQLSLVATITSNKGLEKYLELQNKTLIRTQVGDKHVVKSLEKNNLLLGGEESGHIILNNMINTGDGILVGLQILRAIISSNNWNITTFNKYPYINCNITIKEKKSLNKEPYRSILKNIQNTHKDSRILVRYSGTENVLRILVEHKTEQQAKLVAEQLINFSKQYLI